MSHVINMAEYAEQVSCFMTEPLEPLDAKRMAYSNLPLSEVGSATSKEPDPQTVTSGNEPWCHGAVW